MVNTAFLLGGRAFVPMMWSLCDAGNVTCWRRRCKSLLSRSISVKKTNYTLNTYEKIWMHKHCCWFYSTYQNTSKGFLLYLKGKSQCLSRSVSLPTPKPINAHHQVLFPILRLTERDLEADPQNIQADSSSSWWYWRQECIHMWRSAYIVGNGWT